MSVSSAGKQATASSLASDKKCLLKALGAYRVEPSAASRKSGFLNDYDDDNDDNDDYDDDGMDFGFGDESKVLELVSRGAPLLVTDEKGRSPLHLAALRDMSKLATRLIEGGLCVDMQDAKGMTPLFYAAHLDMDDFEDDGFCNNVKDYKPVAEVLLKHGAFIDSVDNDGDTALHHAARLGDADLCTFLIQSDADTTIKNLKRKSWENVFVSKDPRDTAWCPDGQTMETYETLTSLQKVCEEQRKKAGLESKSRVARTFSSLLFSDKFSDIVLVASGGERFHAHKNVLAASSATMDTLLQGQWAENTVPAVVQLAQSAAAVRALLTFLYSGAVDAAAVAADPLGVLDLAAQHFQADLMAACAHVLVKRLHQAGASASANANANASTEIPAILAAAQQHRMEALCAACEQTLIKSLQCKGPQPGPAAAAAQAPQNGADVQAALALANQFELAKLKKACALLSPA